MNNLFTGLVAILTNAFYKVETVVVQGLTTIALQLPGEEMAIVNDALKAIQADLAAGKSIGTAAADAWTVFYSEEKTEFSKTGQAIVTLFVQALTAAEPPK